jgi:CRISPR system Cascade subunit CasC
MFVQIHMLQSMPPGNLNRDDTGQPKKCVFGGVTRGRISSQCLKRNIRHSRQFKEAFGSALANRTQYLPRMVADELRRGQFEVPDDELDELMAAIAEKFKRSDRSSDSEAASEEAEDQGEYNGSPSTADGSGLTPQLVFFPQPFAQRIAELISDFRKRNLRAYERFIGRRMKPKPTKDEERNLKAEIDRFVEEASNASKSLTVDIALFGRMTTSDLVVNVEAACQVAHAISTHETVIESDWFTAMDDLKVKYAPSQAESSGAAFLGSGETETFFNSAVYYKYLNIDVDALKKHLPSLSDKEAGHVAGVLVSAAAVSHPTGKQNSLANPSVPELILVEASNAKRPISYANAFLQPVGGGVERNFMTESARVLAWYVDSVASAFAPADVRRVLLAVGHASEVQLQSGHRRVSALDELIASVVDIIATPREEGVTA